MKMIYHHTLRTTTTATTTNSFAEFIAFTENQASSRNLIRMSRMMHQEFVSVEDSIAVDRRVCGWFLSFDNQATTFNGTEIE